ncbi:MAG TPA: RDD family protein [Pilimelia sp.]|nr:RDD family protein [Pilimelia sp.]
MTSPPSDAPGAPARSLPPGYAYPPPPGYPGPPPPPLSPGGQPLASFADRLLAYLVDVAVLTGVLLVFAIPAFVVLFVFVLLPDAAAAQTEPDVWAVFVFVLLFELALVLLSLIFTYVYYVEMMIGTGQTLGKKVMKIRIVPLDPAATLNRAMAAKRYLVHVVAGTFLPFFSYLDGFWQLWDKPFQQCLHDKFAETVVVKVPAQ